MATYVVDTEIVNDITPGKTSLLRALQDAAVSAGPDTIVFTAGVTEIDLSPLGGAGLDIDSEVTIDGDTDGDGIYDVTLLLGSFDAPIEVGDGAIGDQDVTLRGLRIAGGDVDPSAAPAAADADRAADGDDGVLAIDLGNGISAGQNADDGKLGGPGASVSGVSAAIANSENLTLERVVFESTTIRGRDGAIGGDGGRAGDGGDGADGIDLAVPVFLNGGAGGDGGDGGKGGSGGDGQDAAAAVHSRAGAGLTLRDVALGEGMLGIAGDGGAGGNAGRGGNGGPGGDGAEGIIGVTAFGLGGLGGDGGDGGFGGEGGDGGRGSNGFLVDGTATSLTPLGAAGLGATRIGGEAGAGGFGGAAGGGGIGGESGNFNPSVPGALFPSGANGTNRSGERSADGADGAFDAVWLGAGRPTIVSTLVYAHAVVADAGEGQDLVFSVIRGGDTSTAIDVSYAFEGLAARFLSPGEDATGVAQFTAGGPDRIEVRRTIAEDFTPEADTPFVFRITGSSLGSDAGIGSNALSGEVVDDDAPSEDADRIVGGDEADAFDGLGGTDTLEGGAGDDSLSGGDGDDSLSGGDDDDELSGGADSDVLKGGGGDDTLSGDGGSDKLEGGGGDDEMSGGRGGDVLAGGGGDDVLEGGGGKDRLKGGKRDDVLSGGGGQDRLEGGKGGDRLSGDGGRDSFVYRSAKDSTRRDTDRIEDFDARKETIDLGRLDQKGRRGDQDLDYIGRSKFSGDGMELRVVEKRGVFRVDADLDGDRKADLRILVDVAKGSLDADDFIL